MNVDELSAKDVMTHLNTEVARLSKELRDQAAAYELRLRAEREYSRRLSAACGLYRSAACEGLAVMREASVAAGDGNAITVDATDKTIESVGNDIDTADELVTPTAEEG